MESKTIRGVKAWLAEAKAASLPILISSARRLTQQIKGGAALADMAVTVEHDPALCMHLFVAANRASHRINEETDILSLNHVMSVLGMQGVIDVVKKQQKFTPHARSAYDKAYIQSQANSLFAAYLCEHWSQEGKIGSSEKLKWATLISGAPNWVMWRCAYPEMRHWEWLRLRDNYPTGKVEKKLFGADLNDILRSLARRYDIPHLSQSLLNPKELPSIKQWAQLLSDRYLDYCDNNNKLRMLSRSPVVMIAICQYLADAAGKGWYQPHCFRAQKMLSHITGQPIEKIASHTHQQAVRFSRQFRNASTVLPAAGLLWPEDNKPWLRQPILCITKAPQEEEQPKSKRKPVMAVVEPPPKHVSKPKPSRIQDTRVPLAKIPPRAPDRDLIQELVMRFSKQAHSFKDIHEILLTCNKAIHEGLGMRRACICVLSKSGDSLRPVYCVGISPESPFRNLRIGLEENRFFAKVMERVSSFKVDVNNFSNVQKMIESNVLEVLGNKDFMVMSLFANKKPIGVIYADASTEEEVITEKEYQAFKKICQSAMYALDNYARKRKRA